MGPIGSRDTNFVAQLTRFLGNVNKELGYLRVNKEGSGVAIKYEPKASTLGGKIVQYFRQLFSGSFNVNRNIGLLIEHLNTLEDSAAKREVMSSLGTWDEQANRHRFFSRIRLVTPDGAAGRNLARVAVSAKGALDAMPATTPASERTDMAPGRAPAGESTPSIKGALDATPKAAPGSERTDMAPGRAPAGRSTPSIISVGGSSLRGEKIAVRDDGNCLYHSLQWGLEDHQDFLARHGLQSGRLDDKQMRREISARLTNMLRDEEGFADQFLGILMNANEQTEEEIRSHEATRDFLATDSDPAASALLDKQIEELRGQILETPAEYVAKVQTDGFWGGEAEIIAFTNRYCVKVKVLEQKPHGIVDTGIPVTEPKAEILESLGIAPADVPTIYIVAAKKHYDYFRPSE